MIVGVVLLLGVALLSEGDAGADEELSPEPVEATADGVRVDSGAAGFEPVPEGYVLAESSTATVACRFDQVSVWVQLLRNGDGPRVVRARGSWRNGTCPPAEAIVTVQLQAKQDGSWEDMGKPGRARISSDSGGSAAAVDRHQCDGRRLTPWRSLIDVDVDEHADDRDVLVSPAVRLPCGPPR